jgi:MoxR-like ATPase
MNQRAIAGLVGNRGLLSTGEPGTAKSMLSELLAATAPSVLPRRPR